MAQRGTAAVLTRRTSPQHLLIQLAAQFLVVLAFAAPRVSAQAWTTNMIATNYGSAYDKQSPWQPSWGTLEVCCFARDDSSCCMVGVHCARH
jgi:hypothetical protein